MANLGCLNNHKATKCYKPCGVSMYQQKQRPAEKLSQANGSASSACDKWTWHTAGSSFAHQLTKQAQPESHAAHPGAANAIFDTKTHLGLVEEMYLCVCIYITYYETYIHDIESMQTQLTWSINTKDCLPLESPASLFLCQVSQTVFKISTFCTPVTAAKGLEPAKIDKTWHQWDMRCDAVIECSNLGMDKWRQGDLHRHSQPLCSSISSKFWSQLEFQAPDQIDATIKDMLTNQPLALTIDSKEKGIL